MLYLFFSLWQVGRDCLWCWLVVLEYGKQVVLTLQSSVGKWFDLQTVVVNMAGTFLPFPLCYRLLGWAVLCWRGMLGPNVIGGHAVRGPPYPGPSRCRPAHRIASLRRGARHVRTWKPTLSCLQAEFPLWGTIFTLQEIQGHEGIASWAPWRIALRLIAGPARRTASRLSLSCEMAPGEEPSVSISTSLTLVTVLCSLRGSRLTRIVRGTWYEGCR
jgi:hypothetical protein